MKIQVRDGTALEVRSVGNGPAIVFHPGFSETAEYWDGVVSHLMDDFQCVTFDPRGHGRSDKPGSDYTILELADDLSDLISALELSDVTVVGHSVGGAVGVTAASSESTAGTIGKLVLSSAAVPSLVRRDDFPGMAPEAHAELVGGIKHAWPDVVANLRNMLYERHEPDAPTVAWLSGKQLDFPAHLAARLMSNIGEINFSREELDRVNVPTLVIGAKNDKVTSIEAAEWLRDNGPSDWQFATLENAGHGSMVDAPAEFAELIRTFVASHGAAEEAR